MKTKRTKIEHYFPVRNDIYEIQHEQRSFDNVDDEELSGITLDAPFVQAQDKGETNVNPLDLEKDVENSYLQELSSVEVISLSFYTSLLFIILINLFFASQTLNPTIERFLNLKEGIS
jgi:hypothetical protein